MNEDLAATKCPACREAVFDRGSVVTCSRCDEYQHLKCWNAGGRCRAATKCKGKPVPVAVVKLQPPGPTAAEISEAVEARTQELLHPIIADLRSAMAHGEDVETVRVSVAQTAEATLARIEQARIEMDTRTENIRRLVAAVETRLAAAPPPIDRGDLTKSAKEIREGVEGAAREAGASMESRLAELRSAVSSELHEILLAVEACRWDTGARRHPLPWDDRTDDVLDPRGAGRGRQ
jgi:hypothetical protein